MIIWINGPYGVGKSTLAEVLQKYLPNSFIFDAEQVGNAVRDNMPARFFRETFEEFPLWQEMCYRLLKELDEVYDGCVLVPMTLKLPASHDAILQRLRDFGAEIVHILLEADHDTVHDRIIQRGEEEDCWCMQNIDTCIRAQKDYPCDLRLQTAGKTVEELAHQVVRAFNLK